VEDSFLKMKNTEKKLEDIQTTLEKTFEENLKLKGIILRILDERNIGLALISEETYNDIVKHLYLIL
jgi:hypothetical protein